MILIELAICHGRSRGFEPRRPSQISKDLGPIWHVTLKYKIVQQWKSAGAGMDPLGRSETLRSDHGTRLPAAVSPYGAHLALSGMRIDAPSRLGDHNHLLEP
jgi:hypothetical protein